MSAEQPPVPVPSIVCTLMASLVVFALGAGPQAQTPASEVPSAIEQALIERACRATDTSPAESDAHRQCISAQLLSLRTDFGRDLSRLSGSDRRNIDAACSRMRAAEQREAYLDCLGNQLVGVRNRRNRGKPAASGDITVVPAPLAAPEVAPGPPPRPVSSWSSATVIAAAVGGVLAAGLLLAVRSRHRRRSCRVCGVKITDADLCPACRHKAAEALRQAAVQRAQSEKAHEDEERRQREYQAEQREQKARDEDEARMRAQELAERQADEDAHRASQAAVAAVVPVVAAVQEPEVFDPYAVLGIQPEASQEDIRTAYKDAMARYDQDLVSHLSDEVQAHFKAKAESVERAYQMLSVEG